MKFSSFTVKAIAVSLLLASSTGLALAGANYKGERNFKAEVPCPTPPVLRDGLYVGVQGGYDSYRVREDFGLSAFGASVDPSISASGGVGGLFLGYGMDLSDMFYLGAEVFGNYSGAESDFKATFSGLGTLHSKTEARGAWGVSILPGLRLNPALLAYVRLGYNWSSLKVEASGSGFSSSKTNTSGGFNYGFGMESLIVDNWSVRAEFSHTDYSSSSSNFVHFKPADNQFMAGIVYHVVM